MGRIKSTGEKNIPRKRKSKKDKKAECLRKDAELSAPNEYNPNLKPILVGGAFGLFFYKLIQVTSLFYYAIICI